MDDEMHSIGDELTSMLSGMAGKEQRELMPGEYMGDDGLIYCASCRTPKQCRIKSAMVPGAMLRLPIACACINQRIEDEKADDKRRADMRRISELRGASLMTGKLRASTFDAWETHGATYKACRRYADRFDEMLKSNQGLLFYGPPGTGKTFAAACIANALLDRGIPALMTSMVRLMAVLEGRDDESDVLTAMSRAKLLVIDDLGAERDTGYGLEKAYGFIDARYRDAKPMILTTNLSLDSMQREGRLAYQRIFDRVLECCYPVEFTGPSRRTDEAARRFDAMRQALEL